jgi:hypothetical protein
MGLLEENIPGLVPNANLSDPNDSGAEGVWAVQDACSMGGSIGGARPRTGSEILAATATSPAASRRVG